MAHRCIDLTAEEAEKISEEERVRVAESSQASDPTREAPPEGGDGSPGASGNVGGYNSFWIDRGTDAFSVDGKFRVDNALDRRVHLAVEQSEGLRIRLPRR